MPLLYLEPGDRTEPEDIAVYIDEPEPIPLKPGIYRVEKSVDLTPGKPRPPTMTLRTTFRILQTP